MPNHAAAARAVVAAHIRRHHRRVPAPVLATAARRVQAVALVAAIAVAVAAAARAAVQAVAAVQVAAVAVAAQAAEEDNSTRLNKGNKIKTTFAASLQGSLFFEPS